MKVINPEMLKTHHPKNWEVEQLHIGTSKNRIIKIKNFFENPEQVRAYAQSADYVNTVGGQFSNLPGFVSKIGHLSHQFYPNFKFLLSTYFEADKKVMMHPEFSHFTFQMYEVQEKCRMCSLAPHTDDTHYAAVLPLNFDEELVESKSGTAFWRNKEFKEEFVCTDRNYRTARLSNKVNAYVNFDPSQYKSKDWERYHVEQHEYNTLLVYEGKMWHSPYFDQSGWSTNRLTFNAFLQ
tara:strand:+ start:6647 stop:7357 length:711 start_codon:yes stop_codon:yes gene_type:complete